MPTASARPPSPWGDYSQSPNTGPAPADPETPELGDPCAPPPPPRRRLRGYAIDPSLATRLDTAPISQVHYSVRWEPGLQPGPVGEYLEVVDVDPASQCFYAPVDLNHPHVLAQDGLPPSEGNPQFHQQMAYAVAMTTIEHFERALGRRAFWRGRQVRLPSGKTDWQFVEKLRVYPHALRAANAYYSPEHIALLFGYFPSTDDRGSGEYPRGLVFTCLSHDVVAHETTHALLDGFHEHFLAPTNEDVLAFHEAFADIVALFQHFSFPEVLTHQIAQTRGDLASENLLVKLAMQFGLASGLHGALRDAIGRWDEATGRWVPQVPDPTALDRVKEVHARGAILVAAVFDAFVAIYQRRTRDLMRIASEGTGVLRPGALHPDLVGRLAQEAARAATQALRICLRALDYCPPVDLTFGDYLRALITADMDLVPDDANGYRVAFIDAFRRRGIYPPDVRTLSPDSLRWPRPTDDPALSAADRHTLQGFVGAIGLRDSIARLRYLTRRKDIWDAMHGLRRDLHQSIDGTLAKARLLQNITGLALTGEDIPDGVRRSRDGTPSFQVYAVREALRQRDDGEVLNQAFITLLQNITPDDHGAPLMCGCTLVINLDTGTVDCVVRKGVRDAGRLARIQQFRAEGAANASLADTYFRTFGEPFAAMHRHGA